MSYHGIEGVRAELDIVVVEGDGGRQCKTPRGRNEWEWGDMQRENLACCLRSCSESEDRVDSGKRLVLGALRQAMRERTLRN